MNRYFDFSSRQLKFLLFLSLTAVVIALYLFVKTYATKKDSPTLIEVNIGESQYNLVGIFIIDPNSSPADSLELLPGIGRVLADRIVAYRQHTRFESEIDITEVNGIGPKLYEKIKPYLKVRKYWMVLLKLVLS